MCACACSIYLLAFFSSTLLLLFVSSPLLSNRATTADYWNGPEDRGAATAKMVKPPPRFGHVAVGFNVQYGENLEVREFTYIVCVVLFS